MTTQYIETLIIGAGQAGLSTGYHLQRRGRPFLIVDGNKRVGDNWRQQWDTLRLYTPAKYDGLPGLSFPADRWHFPHKDEVADYLEAYALHWDLPVRMSTRIDRLEARADGGYVATLGPDSISCDNVAVATGSFGRTPYVPGFAADLDPSITQLHSSEYRRPNQLQPGLVLVVGASHSGSDIAHEVASTHETILCGRDCGQIPARLESRRARVGMPVLVFVAKHVLTRRTPIGRKLMTEARFHGGPHLRVKREDLAQRGVERALSRVSAAVDGRPALDDGRVVDAANVVWCTGFRQVFDWIDLPILDRDGWPAEYRGVVESAPGLFFCGLSFQYAFSSMVFPGVGRDADYIAGKIGSRSQSTVPAAV
ncbi:MAG TPA: NAD(P)/FAD-dependent oxidoreductase [Propionibacteriaceae bacterium]|jgi:putative flavoprotein involved in K+ transport|nr:NAD(P)/FAD-dependent oxidoreductase [Propionibacteriaceae bacterium]